MWLAVKLKLKFVIKISKQQFYGLHNNNKQALSKLRAYKNTFKM